MDFKMNGRIIRIIEVGQEVLQREMGEIDGMYFGLAIPDKQLVYILDTLSDEQKRKTLYHELMHCYIFTFITFNPIECNEDTWCDISANSHDIIHDIVEKYFKK